MFFAISCLFRFVAKRKHALTLKGGICYRGGLDLLRGNHVILSIGIALHLSNKTCNVRSYMLGVDVTTRSFPAMLCLDVDYSSCFHLVLHVGVGWLGTSLSRNDTTSSETVTIDTDHELRDCDVGSVRTFTVTRR